MFSKQGSSAIKKDITNTVKLCEALGMPHEKFQSIHIAGTNGKGSTSHMMAAILQKAGYKVGLYTSPHLVDFRERIRINGAPIGQEWVVNFVATHQDLVDDVQPSFFEITVAMAFCAFAEQEVDIAVIETGLGGRLDSTNIITPILSIITNISYDHKDILGETLPEIAAEKAGIIKQQVPVVIGQQQAETERVFFEHAVRKQSPVYYADALWDLVRTKQDLSGQYFKAVHRAKREMYDLKTDLTGSYQKHNIKTVLAAVDVLISSKGLNIPFDLTIQALSEVKQLTGLHGRWDVLQQQPLIVADVAHNPAGIEEVMQQWGLVKAEQKHIVVGFVKDKDVDEALSIFPKDATYYFCNAGIPRALPASSLHKIATEAGLAGNIYGTVADAVRAARNGLKLNDALLITGSFFIVGEAIEYLNANNGLLFATPLK
ncbi:MAG: bifunctional folylpolyglutamate synthase/dihydrofolate synthase [Sphingobacteriales bacterium]|nr:MAG: bifunctional folylpolyglutamate synthase/dihydrofolate synthase [Sphingobacteriales bacterium]